MTAVIGFIKNKKNMQEIKLIVIRMIMQVFPQLMFVYFQTDRFLHMITKSQWTPYYIGMYFLFIFN